MACSKVKEVSGDRVFVVGDLHGCFEEPKILLDHLEKREKLTDEDLVVFLGDYIDRGPSPKNLIDHLIDFKSRFPKTTFLRGNHEDMLLDFLGLSGRLGESFLYNGGIDTIQSYGISVFSSPEEMVNHLPKDHFDFFTGLDSIVVVNDSFICVHAGLNPLRELLMQNDGEIFWIRDEFIQNIHPFRKTVIFGHTPFQEILVDMPYKIGLDTGLVFGNKLSCLELTQGRLMQIEKGGIKVKNAKVKLEPRF